MHRIAKVLALVGAMAVVSTPLSAYADDDRRRVEIPRCTQSLGTAAVRMPPEATDWWSGQRLSSPDTVVKALVQESGCFTLVDRGAAMQLADEERARAAGGVLQAGSNIGNGQVRAADYIIIPTVVTQNDNAGGTSVGGLFGFVPGIGSVLSAVAGGLNFKKKEASVHLEIVDVRTSEVRASTDGHAKKRNISWGGGAGGYGYNGFAAFGAGSYTSTDMGQVIAAAYVDAYTQLVHQVGGTSVLPDNAADAAPPAGIPLQASATTIRNGVLRAEPSTNGAVVRDVPAGTVLYPTGETDGSWVRMADEVGAEGWISSLSVRNN